MDAIGIMEIAAMLLEIKNAQQQDLIKYKI